MLFLSLNISVLLVMIERGSALVQAELGVGVVVEER